MKSYDGSVTHVKKYVVQSLIIGRMRLCNVVVLFCPVAKTRTLGQDVMRRFDKITVNYKDNTCNLNIENAI